MSATSWRQYRIWFVWVFLFFIVWIYLNFLLGYWSITTEHWPIAVSMAAGSYVAGSTPMGGGTVGFPVLVMFFDMPANLGRNFGLAIQSIGMTSASIFILCSRTEIESRILSWSIVGALFGLLLGTFQVVAYVDDVSVKLIFASLWMSFALLTLFKNQELCSLSSLPRVSRGEAAAMGITVGLLGGVTASLTGVGIDMILYTVLVLLLRTDLKIAIPTSVIIMAATSIMGILLHLVIGDIQPEVFYNWLAASPVVLFGAPLGAFFVGLIQREKTLFFVSMLCVFQFIWAIYETPMGPKEFLVVIVVLAVALLGYAGLYRWGKRRAQRGNLDPASGALTRRGLEEHFPAGEASLLRFQLEGPAPNLAELVRLLHRTLREGDLIARLPEEGFVIVLPSLEEEIAQKVGARVRAALEASLAKHQARLSSFRVLVRAPGEGLEDLLQR